jgi:hypothetical protein
MKNILISITILLILGCTSIKPLPTIENPQLELSNVKLQYANELASIQVGDYIVSIANLFPEMVIVSNTMKNTIYEFDYKQKYFLSNDGSELEKTYIQTLRFYFINKKLVHWQEK